MELHERITYALKVRGKKQAYLCQQLGISSAAVSMLCSGKNTPSPQSIKQICVALSINEQWLKTGEGEMEAPQTKENMIAELTTKYAKMDVNSAKYKLCMTLSRLLVDMDDSMVDELMDVARQLADNSSSEE